MTLHLASSKCFSEQHHWEWTVVKNRLHKTLPFFHLLASFSLLPFHLCQSVAVLCAEARGFTSLTKSHIIYCKSKLLFIWLSSSAQYPQGSGLDENWKHRVLQMNLPPQPQCGFSKTQLWERTACSKAGHGPYHYMKKKETKRIWERCGTDITWNRDIIQ